MFSVWDFVVDIFALEAMFNIEYVLLILSYKFLYNKWIDKLNDKCYVK